MTDYDDLVVKAHAEWRRRANAIDEMNDYTLEARARLAEENSAKLRDTLAELQRREEADRADELARLERRFFTPAPGIAVMTTSDRVATTLAHRDALERARRYADSDDAVSMAAFIADANRTGDDGLARAGVAVALERRDIDGLNAWLEHHPGDEQALQRLLDLHVEASARQSSGSVAVLNDSIRFAPMPVDQLRTFRNEAWGSTE